MNSRRDASLARQKLIVGLAGAPGIGYGLHLLERLQALADKIYPFRSTSLQDWPELEQASGQIILPCGTKTLTDLVEETSHNLILQAAQQTLKRQARLLLLWHEPTWPAEHAHLLDRAKQQGAIIIPAISPATGQTEFINPIVEQILACFNLQPQ